MSNFVFRIAASDEEFEQIHCLNYQTFAQEIPQHAPNPDGRLVDKFHAENTYMIALDGGKLVGMTCVRDKRPFSLDQKLEYLDSYLPPHKSICEIRLLAIDKNQRGPTVFQGLMRTLADYCESKGYDLGIMSGTTQQARLYKHLGFIPFGPLVGRGEILFQPMYITFDAYDQLKNSTKFLVDKKA